MPTTLMARILVIDDDAMLRELLQTALGKAGYQVEVAAEGNAGLAAQKSNAFDLVITDLIMPGMEGIETIIELRHLDPHVKIIAISGGGQGKPDNYLSMAGKLGARRTLARPFSLQQLTTMVDEVLQEP